MTTAVPEPVAVRRVCTQDLTARDLAQLLDLFHACWPDGDFSTDDLAHAIGGVHWVAEAEGRIVAHATSSSASWRPTASRSGRATSRRWRRAGLARPRARDAAHDPGARAHRRDVRAGRADHRPHHACMRGRAGSAGDGPAYVRTADGAVRTKEEDDGVIVLRTPRTPPLTATEALSCEWRAGDAW